MLREEITFDDVPAAEITLVRHAQGRPLSPEMYQVLRAIQSMQGALKITMMTGSLDTFRKYLLQSVKTRWPHLCVKSHQGALVVMPRE